MTTELFMKITMAVISIATALITGIVIPYVRSKMTEQQMQRVYDYVSVAVKCAEQIYTPAQWAEKKNYVLQFIKEKINTELKINLTDNDLETIIEGIVFELKHEKKMYG